MADPYQARGQARDARPARRAGTRVPSRGSGSIRWPVRDAQAALIRRYVQVGVVRSVWRDSPCMDGQSFWAAVAARAAGVQGKFWAFHGSAWRHAEQRYNLRDRPARYAPKPAR
jgi:hypothetical protein